MTQLLEHFLPNTELNLQNLRACVESLARGGLPAAPPNPVTPSASEATYSSYALDTQSVVPDTGGVVSDDDVSISAEMAELHQELGKMRLDNRGVASKLQFMFFAGCYRRA
jgi:hypothetical protein